MKTIYRYEINDGSGINKIEMPRGAKVLSVGIASNPVVDHEIISLWALVDTDEPNEDRTFIVVGTGVNMDDYHMWLKYIGTLNKSNKWAFHVFEAFDDVNKIDL